MHPHRDFFLENSQHLVTTSYPLQSFVMSIDEYADSALGNLHVVPLSDLREHEASGKCWCRPTQDEEEPKLWIHHAMDRREEYENGRKPS